LSWRCLGCLETKGEASIYCIAKIKKRALEFLFSCMGEGAIDLGADGCLTNFLRCFFVLRSLLGEVGTAVVFRIPICVGEKDVAEKDHDFDPKILYTL